MLVHGVGSSSQGISSLPVDLELRRGALAVFFHRRDPDPQSTDFRNFITRFAPNMPGILVVVEVSIRAPFQFSIFSERSYDRRGGPA